MENLLEKLEKENKELKETKASQMKGIRLREGFKFKKK